LATFGRISVLIAEFAPEVESLGRSALFHQQRCELEFRFLGGIFQLRHAVQNLDRLAGLIHPAEDGRLFAEQRGSCLVAFFENRNSLERLAIVALHEQIIDLLPTLQQRFALEIFGSCLQFRCARRLSFCGQFLGLGTIERGQARRGHCRHLRIPRLGQALE